MNSYSRQSICISLLLMLFVPHLSADTLGNGHHSKEFWQQIAHNDYRIPAGESAAALISELSDDFGSPDPELRDELAYDISSTWIYRDQLLSGNDLRSLVHKCEENLGHEIGENGTDSVLLRSFSALELSVVAALDNKKPVLSDAEFGHLLTSAISYMNAERDLRGYDPQKGWIHATAHTSDLLKFLGRNPRLATTDQPKILDAIERKLRQDGHSFVFGENERMAAALLSLIRRKDFDQRGFDSWLEHFADQDKSLWAKPELNVSEFAAVQNSKDLLRSLLVQLELIEGPEPHAESAKSSILACLKQLR